MSGASFRPSREFAEDPRVWEIYSWNLPESFYVILGSAASIARGLFQGPPGDVDVVAVGPAWDMLVHRYGPPEVMPAIEKHGIPAGTLRLVVQVPMDNRMGEIEILNRWFGEDPTPIIENVSWARVGEGRLPIAAVFDLLRYMAELYRLKDIKRLQQMIEWGDILDDQGIDMVQAKSWLAFYDRIAFNFGELDLDHLVDDPDNPDLPFFDLFSIKAFALDTVCSGSKRFLGTP